MAGGVPLGKRSHRVKVTLDPEIEHPASVEVYPCSALANPCVTDEETGAVIEMLLVVPLSL